MLRTACIIVAVFLFAAPIAAQVFTVDEDIASPWAVTTDGKEKLLDRAEAMLLWYRTMDQETRLGTPAVKFREQMAPLELMQAAALLKEAGRDDVSRMIREMLPFFQATPAECFEIEERLGSAMLESFLEDKEQLGGEGLDSTTRIREGTAKFMKSSLRPSEKMALMKMPETAFELMKAVDTLSVAGRPVLVRHFLNQFLETEETPEDYARIAEKIGSRKLMQMAVNPDLAPQAGEAVNKIFSEAKKHWQDKGTISQALEDWQGFDQRLDENGRLTPASAETLRALWRGDRLSVAQLLDKLAAVTDEKEADELLAVLFSFSPDVREALSESLNSSNETLVAHAARGLAGSLSPQNAFLLYPVLFSDKYSDAVKKDTADRLKRRGIELPHADRAAATLFARGNDYLEKNRPLTAGPDGFVRFWNWDENDGKAKYVRMSVPAAYRLYTWRYARQAWLLRPETPAIRRLYLTALFERTAHLGGLDEPIDTDRPEVKDAVESVDVPQLERVLLDALAKEYFGAARVAVVMLGKTGDADSLLLSKDGRPRPLVQATMAKNRRVRFAALEAIMTLAPKKPYPGSSLVVETLTWFSRADGHRLLVSAHPKQSSAAKTAGHFIALGYGGELAPTSRDAMLLAVDSPDVEMMVIDLVCENPPVPIIVQEMRSDARTAEIPIAVVTDKQAPLDSAVSDLRLTSMQKIDRIGADNPFSVSLSKIYPRIVSDEAARWIHDDLIDKTGAETVPPQIRLEQANKALTWIKDIIVQTRDGGKTYHVENLDDIVSQALHSDVRVRAGLELAENVKSGAAQAGIYEVIASNVYPMELRENAAEAFKSSVDRFGILLRGKQVQRLYDRYNASEFEEKEVQELLSRIIDLVEEKTFKD